MLLIIEPGIILRIMEGMAIRSMREAAKRSLASSDIGEQKNANYPVLEEVKLTKEEKTKITKALLDAGIEFDIAQKLIEEPRELSKHERNQVAKALIPILGYDEVSVLLG